MSKQNHEPFIPIWLIAGFFIIIGIFWALLWASGVFTGEDRVNRDVPSYLVETKQEREE